MGSPPPSALPQGQRRILRGGEKAVSGDGYAWQNIYRDQYGQAEDIYYGFCVAKETNGTPPYRSLQPADREILKSAQIER